jgi:hypothetical protein
MRGRTVLTIQDKPDGLRANPDAHRRFAEGIGLDTWLSAAIAVVLARRTGRPDLQNHAKVDGWSARLVAGPTMRGLSRQRLNRGAAAHLRRCADAAERDQELPAPPKRPTVYTAPKRHLNDRLTAAELDRLLADYKTGGLRRELAEQYGISMSSVARLIRQHGACRRQPISRRPRG